MSKKKTRISEANILAEQRYLLKKFINEDEVPQTPQPEPTQTTEDLTNLGVNVNDTTTHQSIIQQLEPHKDKVNLDLLKKNIGNQNFFTELSKYVKLQPKSVSNYGATIKVGDVVLNGNFNVKEKEIGDVGLQYKTKVGNTPTTLMLKTKDPGSIATGDFDLKNVQAGVKINIPQTNKNKSHGNML
jgi:hypothetical protein